MRCVSALVLLAAPSVAFAQPGPSPDALIEHGVELREQGHDDLALVEFERALRMAPTPRARAQVGLAEQALGHWARAEEHLAEVLATAGDAWVEAHRQVLAAAAAAIAPHLGSLEVSGGPPGAEVVIDGKVLGVLPLAHPLRIETGPRLLEVRYVGYYPVLRTLFLASGTTAREAIDLAPLVPAAARAAPAHPHDPPADTAPPALAPSGTIQKTLAFGGFGVGAALVAVGIVGLFERQSAVNAYNADPTCPGAGATEQPGACSDQLSTASTWRAVSVVSFISGGVMAGVSTVLLVTAPSSPHRGVVAFCSAGPGRVACEGRF